MIYGIYFSPTSNTKKVVETMSYHLDLNAQIIDITCKKQSCNFNKDDFVIIGAPVYGGRIPSINRERLADFIGNETPCVIVATYGNRHYDDALVEMSDIFTANGFVVHGAAAIIGRHTYGEIQVNRPDTSDLLQCRSFIEEIYHRHHKIECELPGNHHDDVKDNRGRFHPLTDTTCVGCQICVKNCPVQAISDDCVTVLDSCISCFRCIRNCPVQAKNINTDDYQSFAQRFSERLKERRENEFFK